MTYPAIAVLYVIGLIVTGFVAAQMIDDEAELPEYAIGLVAIFWPLSAAVAVFGLLLAIPYFIGRLFTLGLTKPK